MAGTLVLDANTRQPAVGALPVEFVRSPDRSGPDGLGRYLISVNSGYGIQFNSSANIGQQSLGVIDLNARPGAQVIQNVYFPSPQSVNVGVVFAQQANPDGTYQLYVSGGFENKIWIFQFQPGSKFPITPTSPGPNTTVDAPFIDVTGFASSANSPRYNTNRAPVYPTGLSLSSDGNSIYVANNLGDSLGIIHDVRGARKLETVPLRGRESKAPEGHFTYPYGVVAISQRGRTSKVYVSCWNDSSVAVIDLNSNPRKVSYIPVGRHPTSMLWDEPRARLYVVNSDDDSVSMIDPRNDREVERINVRLAETERPGNSPEGIALDQKGTTLFVANAHSNSVAVVALNALSLDNSGSADNPAYAKRGDEDVSRVRGFIPTGQYPSAVAIAGTTLFVANGKGTGLENSSVLVNNSGYTPNAPNDRFPAGTGRGAGQGGQYSASLVVGNISAINVPEDVALASYTRQVMQNNGLLGRKQPLFAGRSPIKHVIYVIKENRTYDQVFGDVEASGDGTRADGDRQLAIFGSTEAAARPDGTRQDIAPNHRALARRFGLFDRFFVNSEASPDGHNWSTAAFSTDYVDKAFRWDYSRRGRGYDYEGFNRLPNYEAVRNTPPLFGPTVDAEEISNFMRRFIPYLHGSRDVAEPQTLYLWDAAARTKLTHRNYGEFIATLSQSDVAAIKANTSKTYPDLSPTVSAFPTKKSLEGNFSTAFRNFDMDTPDAMTTDSYREAKQKGTNPLISGTHSDTRFRGTSRMGVWLDEFRGFVTDVQAGKPDRMPNLSIVRLSNDHTSGLTAKQPTPQFFVADNDYALGLMVEAVSNSPYWKDTAIFVVEDDAQDGADHVDAHRSVALVISAYNRPGILVHQFHNTVSLIRTIELLLGIAPMNQLDANATPMDVFRNEPDLRPYEVLLPNVALDNLMNQPARDAATAYWIRMTEDQDLSHADMADPEMLNRIIWFSVKGNTPMPAINRLPAFDAMRLGLNEEREEIAERSERGARPRDLDDDE
jgi:YVTN family beta-propeller protein